MCTKVAGAFCGFVVQSVQNGGESDESAGCGKRGGGCVAPRFCCSWRAAAAMVFSHFLLPRGGAARAVVHGEAVNNGKRRRKPPLSPHCAKRNAARVPRPADFAEVRRMGGSALVRKTRRLARWGRGRGRGKPRRDIEALLRKGLTEYISKLCRSALLLLLAGCCRDVVLALSATPVGARHAPLFTAKP